MKQVELKPVARNKRGKIIIRSSNLEKHEIKTLECLASFGFDIETIIPSNTPGSNNPDILMLGTYWEMKGPKTANKNTLKKRFRKAIKQSGGKAIFDLRNKKGDIDKVRNWIMRLFKEVSGMRRIIIIVADNTALDIIK